MFTLERGGIIITHHFEAKAHELANALLPLRSCPFVCEDFKIEDAKAVIAEAYKAESTTKTLILGAKSFTIPAQNALLKILEEPPPHIVFILLSPTKSTFLPTILSRMALHIELNTRLYEPLELSLRHLDLAHLFGFVKAHDKLKKHEAKALVEQLFHHTVYHEKYPLSTRQLEGFDKAFRLIELNARTQTLLVMLLMNFLKESLRDR